MNYRGFEITTERTFGGIWANYDREYEEYNTGISRPTTNEAIADAKREIDRIILGEKDYIIYMEDTMGYTCYNCESKITGQPNEVFVTPNETHFYCDDCFEDKSHGHKCYIGKCEYFIRDGSLYVANIAKPIMPDGYRCGRWLCAESMADDSIRMIKAHLKQEQE